jgi:hypothetical protein
VQPESQLEWEKGKGEVGLGEGRSCRERGCVYVGRMESGEQAVRGHCRSPDPKKRKVADGRCCCLHLPQHSVHRQLMLLRVVHLGVQVRVEGHTR